MARLRRSSRGRGSYFSIVLVALAALAATACQPRPVPLPASGSTAAAPAPSSPYRVLDLTPDQTDRFLVTSGSGTITGRAPSTNRSTNLRVVGYDRTVAEATNQESCVTWVSGESGKTQPGIALRIRQAGGSTRAIIVTDNIYFNARWIFNVHLAESTASPNVVLVGSLSAGWSADPLPWRICGRAVDDQVTIRAWPLRTTEGEPSWDDPAYAATVTVPRDWVYAGRPGWYMGHLAAGESIQYQDPTTAVSRRPPPPTSTPPIHLAPTPRPGP